MDEKRRTEKSKKIISQYKTVFGTKEGRAVLYDLMKSNFILDTSPFVAGAPDQTALNLGKQELVKQILFMLKIDPEKFFELQQEQELDHV